MFDYEHSIRQRRGETGVLFHEHHRVAALLQLVHRFAEPVNDDRRKPFGNLVEQ